MTAANNLPVDTPPFPLNTTFKYNSIESLARVKDPLYLAHIAAAHADINFERRQKLLEEDSLKAKLEDLVGLLSREKEVLLLGKKIQSEARIEMNKTQRDYYLRQQLKSIKKELGEKDEEQPEVEEYRQRIEKSEMNNEARKEAQRELDRFAEMTSQSAEHSMIRTYLDWLLDLPWNRMSEEQADLDDASKVLDKDHCGEI